MKILIIAHYGQQPPYNTMRRYHNWGVELVRRGHEVCILSASTVHNTDNDLISILGSEQSVVNGIKYIYIKTPRYTGNGRKRIKNMLCFCRQIKRHNDIEADVIIISGAYLYRFAKKAFKSTPIIADIPDLWPSSIVEYANVSKSNPLIRVLFGIEKNTYKNCDALIFSMEGGPDYVREQPYSKKIDFSKVFHINMGCSIVECDKNLKEDDQQLPWDFSKYNIIYCGSIRQANQVKTICVAAKEIQNRGMDNIEFQIYGNGDELDELKQFVKNEKIENVHFYGRITKEMIPGILAHSDANILTYKQVPLMKYGGSQSKLFDYLASGKPIICNAIWGYNLIERYNCGVITEDQTPESFANTVSFLFDLSDDERVVMGRNARKVAELYDQPQLVDKLCEVIKYAISKRGR